VVPVWAVYLFLRTLVAPDKGACAAALGLAGFGFFVFVSVLHAKRSKEREKKQLHQTLKGI
jgi:hypothetical protein